MLIRFALGLALFETLVLAGVLLAWADRVAGGRLLAAFLLGIAIWITGNELPNWLGADMWPLAKHLLGMAPFISVFFFHFCVVFCRVSIGTGGLRAAYALGGFATLLAQFGDPAKLVWQNDIGWLAVATNTGVVASMAWVILAVGGVSVLLRGLAKARAPARQQIAAVTASCLWGLLCLTGYAIALLDWPLYPFPLLLLPLYPVILVYGILRYGVFVANAWAGRALAWALLLAVGAAVLALMPLVLPFESRWLNGMAVAASCLALMGPVGRFAHRLVYPGAVVSVSDIAQWRQTLTASASLPELADTAGQLLGMRLGMPVDVAFGACTASGNPQLVCERGSGGLQGGAGWTLTLLGWESAPPGQRHVAELFGQTVLEAARYVDQLQQRAGEERQRQLQARLAELGSLAATVAHDIRNPLNIISMAVATAPHDTRREVAEQIQRIAHLSSDLLDYAKPWSLKPALTDLSALVHQYIETNSRADGSVRLGVGLAEAHWLKIDAMRVTQAVTNLLANAQRAVSETASEPADAVFLDIETTGQSLLMHICDNGPGVPEAMRSHLFEPFASRSPGGTGLGLAIVARVMAAHGGTAALTERAGWRTCFTLNFPL